MPFIAKLLISALSIGVAAYIVPGIHINNFMTLLITAFIFGILNALVRPILVLLTLPITVVTLGIFLLIINAFLFLLVSWIVPGFSISSFWSALTGWVIVVLTNWVASAVFKK
ncbi:MAG TPA: phage holin family protein [Chitinispirillaceae bacterium]|nr:phage holin family protein [Chitinispirillaceae bacterium]